MNRVSDGHEYPVRVVSNDVSLDGSLSVPEDAGGVVLFAHGSGSSRLSPRNSFVAQQLQKAGFGTLLFDLLTREEEDIGEYSAKLRFDIELLAKRLAGATDWIRGQTSTPDLPVGYFGASTGAAAALVAAAEEPDDIRAIVSRGGRPDLAGEALSRVEAPTLLVVGEDDLQVIGLNKQAMSRLDVETDLAIIPGATHLFEEPGALEEVARLAIDWFRKYLPTD